MAEMIKETLERKLSVLHRQIRSAYIKNLLEIQGKVISKQKKDGVTIPVADPVAYVTIFKDFERKAMPDEVKQINMQFSPLDLTALAKALRFLHFEVGRMPVPQTDEDLEKALKDKVKVTSTFQKRSGRQGTNQLRIMAQIDKATETTGIHRAFWKYYLNFSIAGTRKIPMVFDRFTVVAFAEFLEDAAREILTKSDEHLVHYDRKNWNWS